MKMAIRMPAYKIERDEIDENDWPEIQTVIEEAVQKHVDFRRDEGMSLEKEFQPRIGNIRHTWPMHLDPERVQAIKDRLQTANRRVKSKCRRKSFWTRRIYYLKN
jgi:uncharacterized protein YicC (UPF0701 family)